MNILFIDRDGTLIYEPKDFQIDSLEKLELLPKVITTLNKLKSQYRFVMVSNQDGLGSDSFPQSNFEKPQKKLLRLLENEGIYFEAILICPHLGSDNCDCRKPKTKLILDYLYANDIQINKHSSYVIGDRKTDNELAKRLDIGFIKINQDNTDTWLEATHILLNSRKSSVKRVTAETQVEIEINLDGTGVHKIETGLPFFNHMLEQIAVHSEVDLMILASGDLNVDGHHLIEDSAICLGEVIIKAISPKIGIERYGFLLPMDESEATISIDLSNRFYFNFSAEFQRTEINGFPTEMVKHFFKSLAEAMKINLHMSVSGENDHHKIEALFKGFARCLKQAVKLGSATIPSSKEIL